MTPELIAVIGPVEPELLATWVRHYRRLGIESFRLAFHFPDHVPHERRDDLLVVCRDLGVTPARISTGPWHEHTNARLRDTLREAAGSGWHLFADADEFHTYPAPVPDVIAAVEVSRGSVVGGLFLDRVAADGRLAAWLPQTGLDRAFPLGGPSPTASCAAIHARSSSRAPPWPWPPATTAPPATSPIRTPSRPCTTSSGAPESWRTCDSGWRSSPAATGPSTPRRSAIHR